MRRRRAAAVLLCGAAFLPPAAVADDAGVESSAEPAAEALPGPLPADMLAQLAVQLQAEQAMKNPAGRAKAPAAAPQRFVIRHRAALDPVELYQARLANPGTGLRVGVDTYWEEVSFGWRVSF